METAENIFNNSIEQEGTLFKRSEVFTLEYMPENLRFRTKEIQAMGIYSRSLNSGYAPPNMEITGAYATGKTTAVLKYFELIENKFNVATVYINCEYNKTQNQMLIKIYNKLFNKKTKTRITDYLLKNKIMNYLHETGKILVVYIDDYGSNKINSQDIEEINKFIYTLFRGHETRRNVKASLITITNRKYINFILSQSAETMFNPIEINFDAYELDEMYHILKDRCDLGFARGVISEDVIYAVANHAYQEGDLRLGINCLYEGGRNAELLNSRTIEREHLDF